MKLSPTTAPKQSGWLSYQNVLATAMGGLLGPLLLAIFVTWRYGSVGAAIAAANGHVLMVDSPTKEIGDVPVETTTTAAYTLTNLTGNPIQIQGSRTSCACSVVAGVPCRIAPYGQQTVNLALKSGSKAQTLLGSFELFTDNSAEPIVNLRYSARIMGRPSRGR